MQETFSSFVSALRKKRGMTQKELAETLGFTPQGISRFESIDSSFDLRLLDKLCRTLDISLHELSNRQIEGTHYIEFDLDLAGLPARIKDFREKKDLTQNDLAFYVDTTARSIRSYETGKSLPSFQTLERIAEALDADVDSLLCPVKEKPAAVADPSSKPVPVPLPAPVPVPWGGKKIFVTVASVVVGALALAFGIPAATNWANSRNALPSNGETKNSSILPSLDDNESANPLPSFEESTPDSLPSSAEEPMAVSSSPEESRSTSRYVPYVPNFLTIDTPTHEFHAIGETIEFTVYDPDGDVTIEELDEMGVSLTAQYGNWGAMEVDLEYLGDGHATATLLSGETGSMFWVWPKLRGLYGYEFATYFRYVSGEEVTLVDGAVITDGVLFGDSYINFDRLRRASASPYFYKHGSPIPKPDIRIAIGDAFFPSSQISYDQGAGLGIGEAIEITIQEDKPKIADGIWVFFGVAAETEKSGRTSETFWLKPWELRFTGGND